MVDDQNFVACSREPQIRMFDLNNSSEESTATFEGHKVSVSAIDIRQDSRRMVSGGRDCTTIVWDIET